MIKQKENDEKQKLKMQINSEKKLTEEVNIFNKIIIMTKNLYKN